MTFVVDTNVVIDHLRQRPEATTALAGALRSGRRVTSSVLTRVELARGSRPTQAPELEALDALLEWIPVDHEIAAIAAEHAERFGAAHSGIDTVDYVIAATTARVDGHLLTRNVRHFPMFPDLEAPY